MPMFRQTKKYSYRDPAAYIENGINIMSTTDFKSFKDVRTLYLNQENKPLAVALSNDLINWDEAY